MEAVCVNPVQENIFLRYMRLNIILPLLFGLLLFWQGCEQVKNVFKKKSPRQKYIKAIKKGPLADNDNVEQWVTAGEEALENPVRIDLPFKTKIVFFIDEPNVRAWRFKLPAGRTLKARLTEVRTETSIFMALFTPQNSGFELLKFAEYSSITYTLDEDQTLILRIQAEILTSGSAVLTISSNPSMAFPVKGGRLYDIGGVFGDPREGGERQHEGIDIFANRGTPVVAAACGRVITDRGGLGGKKIWLRANDISVYYAHLDSFAVQDGEKVNKGEVIGFVGNSGNARSTPPHLHFGIYDNEAIPPLPFVKFSDEQPKPVTAKPEAFQKWGRVDAAKANVRPLPSTEEPPIATLSSANPVKIAGATGKWYRVDLPNETSGFMHETLVEVANTPIQTVTVSANSAVFPTFTSNRPLVQLSVQKQIKVYGKYKGRQLARYREHWVWIQKPLP